MRFVENHEVELLFHRPFTERLSPERIVVYDYYRLLAFDSGQLEKLSGLDRLFFDRAFLARQVQAYNVSRLWAVDLELVGPDRPD